jgi:peptidoglycan/LPS O-acetylase OafA/YrhL
MRHNIRHRKIKSVIAMIQARKMRHIEVLRGLAVTLVLFYHLHVPGFDFAYLGVDAFFVISGFLMALLYGDIADRTGLWEFYCRRLSRLLPAYYTVLLLTIVVSALIVLPHEFADVARYAWWSAILAPNVGFWLDTEYFNSDYFRPFLNFWSLGVELQFYLIFPLFAVAHRRWPKLVLLLTLGSLALYLLLSIISPKTAFFQTPSRVWQFMIGFYTARLRLPKFPTRTGEVALLLLAVCILAAPYIAAGAASFAITISVLSGIFIAAGLAPRAGASRPAALMELLGRYSYSIYLVHFPIIAFLAYRPFSGGSLDLGWYSGYITTLLLTAVTSVLLHHLVEVPFLAHRSGRFVLGTVTAGALATSAIAAISLTINRATLSPRESQVVSVWFDRLPYRCPKFGRLLHPFDHSCLVSGDRGPVYLLVGDSHADVLKGELAEAVEGAGGSVRLMIANDAVGDLALSPEAVMAEAQLRNARVIVLHSTAYHFYLGAIERLAQLAAVKDITVAVILPIPDPGYHVPKQIYLTLYAGQQTLKPHRSLDDYGRSHRAAIEQLGTLASQVANLRLFHPESYFCAPMCAIQDRTGQLLYFDGGHLSQTGARVLKPMMQEIASLGSVVSDETELQKGPAASKASYSTSK